MVMEYWINAIQRAIKEFGFKFHTEDSVEDVGCEAEELLLNKAEVDYFSPALCDDSVFCSSSCYTWGDGKEIYVEDGYNVGDDQREWKFYREVSDEQSGYKPIDWFDAKDGDFVLVSKLIDTDAKVVGILLKF